MEMSGFCSFGKMCALRAALGRFICGINAVCVEEMISPCGSVIRIGVDVACLLQHGVSAVKKCPVVPELATAWGGLFESVDEATVVKLQKLLSLITNFL